MRIVSYAIAGLIAFLGLMFLIGSQGQLLRILVGLVLLIGAVVVIYLARVQPKPSTTIQKIDLSGDVSLEEIRCRSCNAALGKEEIDVKAGAIFVECAHCGATYQFEEEPKW